MSSSSAYVELLAWMSSLEDRRFHTNAARVENRDALLGQLSPVIEGLNAESLEFDAFEREGPRGPCSLGG